MRSNSPREQMLDAFEAETRNAGKFTFLPINPVPTLT